MARLNVRRSEERGQANLGWLDSKHTFSFGHYYDPKFMGFGPLRVINEDRVVGGGGFPPHPHNDMEIISIVLEGALAHNDSLGTGSVIRPGELQRMSAGTGIRHSEFNASQTDPVHFLQIWILPAKNGEPPGYEQKSLPPEQRLGQLRLIGSPDGRDGSVTIHQDVFLYAAALEDGNGVSHTIDPNRLGWIQVARGSVTVNEHVLHQGDGVAVRDGGQLTIEARSPSEVLLFDMTH